MHVVIVGGGISGLAAAHHLTRRNIQTSVLEGSQQLGGLGTFFPWRDTWVDRFYHCVMPTDEHLLGLINDVGLTEQLRWQPTTMGFIHGGQRYDFNTPWDLLTFRPLTPAQRLRLGVGTLRAQHSRIPAELDAISCRDWLTRLCGAQSWLRFWQPLLRAKFGQAAGDLPAMYIAQRLGRESNQSVRGYLQCGHKGLIDALAQGISDHGGTIHTRAAISGIRPADESQPNGRLVLRLESGESLAADWVISTVPLPALRRLITGTALEHIVSAPMLRYQGVVNALFFLSRDLTGHYWAPVVNSDTEFDGIIEMSAFVQPEKLSGTHLAYVMRYCRSNDSLLSEPEEDIAERWQGQLLELFADVRLSAADVVDCRVFRSPFVEPVYPLGYSSQKPPLRQGDSRLVLSTTAQVYPAVTSWNSSSRLASSAVDLILANSAGSAAADPEQRPSSRSSVQPLGPAQ